MRPTINTGHPRPPSTQSLHLTGIALVTAASIILLTGCSVFMAAKQPDKKDLDLMCKGTPRAVLVEEFGEPVTSQEVEGLKTEVFRFVQGYSKGAKATRAVLHGTADFLTLGLWEVVGTPTEAVYDGEKMYYEVTYDENDRVVSAVSVKE